MADDDTKQVKPAKVRVVSVLVTVRVESIEQSKAMELENALRDVADDYGAQVTANYGDPRQAIAPL